MPPKVRGGNTPSPTKVKPSTTAAPPLQPAAGTSTPATGMDPLVKGALEDGKRLFGDVLRSIVDASPAKASTKATPTSSAAHSSPIRCHTYSEPPLAVLKEDVHTFSHFHQLRLKEEEGTILERRARKL